MLAYWWKVVLCHVIQLLPDVALGVYNIPPDGMRQNHTDVFLIALVAELKMGCAHTFSLLEDIAEAQRSLENSFVLLSVVVKAAISIQFCW